MFPEAKPDNTFDYCDPSGNAKKETSDYSSVEQLSHLGIYAEFDTVGRKNRIQYLRPYVEGGPERLLVASHCRLMIEALSGAYRYPGEGEGGGGRDPDMPLCKEKLVQKDPHIHIIDSLEYMAIHHFQTEFSNDNLPSHARDVREDIIQEPELFNHAYEVFKEQAKNRFDILYDGEDFKDITFDDDLDLAWEM